VPAYAKSLAQQGYPDVVEPGDLQQMADALPREFVDDLAIIGGRESAQRMLVDMGGVEPLLVPIVKPGDLTAFEAIMRAAVT
jgi:hypothetical protein